MGAVQSPRKPCGTRSASHHKVHRLNSGTVASCSVPNGRALAMEGSRGQVAMIAVSRQRKKGTRRRRRRWKVIERELQVRRRDLIATPTHAGFGRKSTTGL